MKVKTGVSVLNSPFNTLRLLECLTLYFLVPSVIVLGFLELTNRWVLFAFLSFYIFYADRLLIHQYIKHLQIQWVILYVFVFLGALSVIFLFAEQSNHARLSFVFVLYPMLSVPLQEWLFRSFFIRRFHMFPSHIKRLTNILGFAYFHAIYGHWEAVGLSLIGGFLFYEVYTRTSTIYRFFAVCLVHAIVGIVVFLSGYLNQFTDFFR